MHHKLLSLDKDLARKVLMQDSPELQQLLDEFKTTLTEATRKIQPLMKQARQANFT